MLEFQFRNGKALTKWEYKAQRLVEVKFQFRNGKALTFVQFDVITE